MSVCRWGLDDRRAAAAPRSTAGTSTARGASAARRARPRRTRRAPCKGPRNANLDTLCLRGSACRSCIQHLGRCERRKQSRKSGTFSREEETFSRDSACFLKLIVYDQKYVYNGIQYKRYVHEAGQIVTDCLIIKHER